MHKKLKEIIKKTKEDLIKRKKEKPLAVILNTFASLSVNSVNDNIFYQSILNPKFGQMAIITEIKLASPNENNLGNKGDIGVRVKQYEQAGADAISIVTEKHFFKGDIRFVKQIKQLVKLPILQKDFIIDSYQLYEIKKAGTDAILLIAKILSKKDLIALVNLSIKLGIEPVVEINNQNDLKKAVATKTKIIAVNARDLDTFRVDVDKACNLLKKIPPKFLKLGFSGVKGKKEVEKYRNAGVSGVLIGTSLMEAKDVTKHILSLRSNPDVKVKICATRSLKAAETAFKQGAEFIGLVFTPRVRSHTVDLKTAKQISKKMKGKINLVGVFQNMPLSEVQKIITECDLDYGQFHGDEPPEYLKKIKIKKIKAFRFPGKFNLNDAKKQMQKFKVDFYLLDRIKQSEGPMLDLETARLLAKEFPLIFAGGLKLNNVTEIIRKVNPFVVDVASGVETNGQQDLKKITDFIKNAKGALR